MTTQHLSPSAPASEYVLPAPPRPPAEVLLVGAPRDHSLIWRRRAEVARALGEHFSRLATSGQQFLGEVRSRLAALDANIADASRAQLKGAVQDVLAVLDWCDAVQQQAQADGAAAMAGCEPLDLLELCEDVAATHRAAGQTVLTSGTGRGGVWMSAAAAGELVRSAVALMQERAPGSAIALALGAEAGALELHVTGAGDPADPDPDAVSRFRSAVAAVGATVVPDALGPGGCGMRILLPAGN